MPYEYLLQIPYAKRKATLVLQKLNFHPIGRWKRAHLALAWDKIDMKGRYRYRLLYDKNDGGMWSVTILTGKFFPFYTEKIIDIDLNLSVQENVDLHIMNEI